MSGTACEWCARPFEWIAETPNGSRYLCQTHYNQLERERKAERLHNLSPAAVALLHKFGAA